MQNIKDMEGYDEIRRKLLDSFTLEERLAGAKVDEVLKSMQPTPQQIVESLPEKDRKDLLDLLAKRSKH